MPYWSNRSVLVTGGASLIGAHLVKELVDQGATVRVADDFSSGRRENLAEVSAEIEVVPGDLKHPDVATAACQDQEIVLHLAANHGGRGYVDLHQLECATNFGLDQSVFSAALAAGAQKVVFASSGCVYPLHLQTDPSEKLYLGEQMVGPPYEPDGTYGMAKLAGELTLQALHAEHGIAAASCRYFTVYGPLGVENHAVMAMIARAFVGEDPFVVWGDGNQVRNWTYVEDIVRGTLLAAERLDDGSAVNLGTTERIRVADAVDLVFEYTGHRAAIATRSDLPVGPANRVADNSRARHLLGWEPRTSFADGLRRTVDWYVNTKDRAQVRAQLPRLLTERPLPIRAGSVGAAGLEPATSAL